MNTTDLQGTYRDLLVNREGHVLWDSKWRSNRIVQKCNILLAILMKGAQGMQGILYWAVGEGEKDWDVSCPTPESSDTQLTKEVARQALAAEQIAYLDNAGQPTDTPTDCLEITAAFSGAEYTANGFLPLREFGLYGGDATEAPNSGFMIDYVIHPRIDLSPDWTLTRSLRLSFRAGAIQDEQFVGFGAALPVTSIDGVGTEYARDLRARGIGTLGDLITIDPLLHVGNIPKVRLREFRAKARMVMQLRVGNLAYFTPLAGQSISRILREKPEVLADIIGSPHVTPEIATRLQEELAVLQISLDEAQLQSITLNDLMNA